MFGKLQKKLLDRGPDENEIDFNKEENRVLGLMSSIPCSSRDFILEGKELYLLPAEIRQWTNLVTMNLSHNKLKVLPLELFKCVNLEVLDITDNDLLEIPQDIGLLTRLEVLMLSSNHIPRIPDGLYRLDSLVTLFLNDNNIVGLSRKINCLKNLMTLNLANNRLTKIPPEIILLEDLKMLSLQGNDIKEAPVEILSLKLDIKTQLSTSLKSKPITISSNTQCGVLDVSYTGLKNLDITDPENATKITGMDFSGNLLVSLPSEMLMFENLTHLNLKGNKLLKLTGISKFQFLLSLDISHNRFEELPREILMLKGLKTLNIESNPFTQPLPKLTLELDNESMTIWGYWDKRIKRRQVFEELMQTEQNYLTDLKKISHYCNQLEKILTKEESMSIFSHLQNILSANESFYKDLQKVYFDFFENDQFDLGVLFMDYQLKFAVYADYINDYAADFRKLSSEIDKNRKFKDFWSKIPEFQTKNDIAKALSTYFIMPIQRMPRYQLILTELKRNTPSEHPLYENLIKGLNSVLELAEYCNSKKTEREFMDRVGDIAQDLSDPSIVTPDRILLYEVAQCKRIIGEKKRRNAKIYLFNDIVIFIEDKIYKIMNHHLLVERVRDYYNRLYITCYNVDLMLEFDSLMALEEFFQLWIEQNHRFWQEYFSQNYFATMNDTQLTTKVKNISNLRFSVLAPNRNSFMGTPQNLASMHGVPLPKLFLENLEKTVDTTEKQPDIKSPVVKSQDNSQPQDIKRVPGATGDKVTQPTSPHGTDKATQPSSPHSTDSNGSSSSRRGSEPPNEIPVVNRPSTPESKSPLMNALLKGSRFSPPNSPRNVGSPGRGGNLKESMLNTREETSMRSQSLLITSDSSSGISKNVHKLLKLKKSKSILSENDLPKLTEDSQDNTPIQGSPESKPSESKEDF